MSDPGAPAAAGRSAHRPPPSRAREPLARQIAVAALVVVLVFSAIGAWLAWRGYRSDVRGERAAVDAAALQAAAVVESFIRTEIQMLETIAAAPRVVAGDLGAMALFFERADPDGVERGGGFGWVDRDGRLRVLGPDVLGDRSPDVSRRPEVAATLRTGRPQVSDTSLAPAGAPAVTVTAPTADEQGRVSGLVLRTQWLDARNPLLAGLGPLPDTHVVDRNGYVIMSEGPVLPRGLRLTPPGVRSSRDASGSVGISPGRRVVATAPVPTAGWTVVVDPSESEILGPLRRQLAVQVAALALTAGLALGALLLLARRTLRHTELTRELTEANARAAALQRVAASLSASLTLEQVGDVVAREVRDVLGADSVTVGLLDDQRTRVDWLVRIGIPDRLRAAYPSLPIDAPTSVNEAIHARAPVVVADRAGHVFASPELARAADEMGFWSWGNWPLLVRGECIGVLGLWWRSPHRFEPEELAFLDTVADLVAQGAARARAYADEHAVATALQRAVMPSHSPSVPGLVVAGHYRPAHRGSVGGDWYDALALPKGGVLLALGDVVGHGIAAAEDMAQLRNAARALAIEGHGPARLLAELDQVAAVATRGRFATLAVATFDAVTDTITYATAGHVPPMVRRGDGTVDVLDAAQGPPLGAAPDARYVEQRVRLDAADLLVLYSDGLVERPGRGIDDGLAMLEGELRRWPGGRLGALCVELAGSLQPPSIPQRDDVCVLAAAIRPEERATEPEPRR